MATDTWCALQEHDLTDEYRLMLYSVVLGARKRLFGEAGQSRVPVGEFGA